MKTVYHPKTGEAYTGEPVDCREMMQLHGYVATAPGVAGSSGLPPAQEAASVAASTMQEQLDGALGKLPGLIEAGTYKDADFVVTQMRTHFGELFTDEVEAKVRGMFPADPKPPKDKKAK